MRLETRHTGRVLALALAALLCGIQARANYQYVHYSSRNAPFSPIYEKFDLSKLTNNTVTFFVNDQGPAVYGRNDSFGSVLSQIRQAAAAWNAISTSDLRVAFGGVESYTANPTAAAPGNPVPNAATPGGDVVFVDVPGLLGMGAPTTSANVAVGPNGPFYPIVRGVVMLSSDTTQGTGPSYLEEYFTTAIHEIGHAIGLQHTWTSSAMSQGVIRNTSRARPLDADDIAAVSILYGKTNWQANYGTISGTVHFANGQPVSLASVVAIAPTGPAVSTLTNPDGTYRISGLPPNSGYAVYVHPLPPDGVADGEGLRLPVDQNGQAFQPSGPFQTVFFPGTLDPQQALMLNVGAGFNIVNVNFNVAPRATIPTYDVVTYCRIDTSNRNYVYSGDATKSPAYIDTNHSIGTVIAQAQTPAFLPTPQSATLLGGFAPALLSSTSSPPVLLPYPDQPGTIAIYFKMSAGAGVGPRHLVLNFGEDIYVLPDAVNFVQKGPPVVNTIAANPDGSVALSGAGFGPDSRVFFDGVQAAVQVPFSGADAAGSITVMPPQGASGQTSTITIYNADGQNSMILQGANPPTYTYPTGAAAQITGVSVTALPSASSAAVDITASNTNFVDGQVTVGFGTSDVTVRRVWVLSPTHLTVNVVVAPGAAIASSEISVISGLQLMSMPNGFQIQAARSGFPYIGLPVVNADPAQQTLYPGSVASIYGQNLALPQGMAQITLNDQPVPVLFSSPGQVNFIIPAGFPVGPATLKLNNGAQGAFPVMVQINVPPPAIAGVTDAANTPLAGAAAAVGDTLNLLVTGMDPSVVNNPSRVKITLAGVEMPVQQITTAAAGQLQVTFIVTQSFAGSQVPVTVSVDGSASAAAMITVR